MNILCPWEWQVFQSKLGVSSSNQCNLHHSPHTGHLEKKKIKKGYNLFRTRCTGTWRPSSLLWNGKKELFLWGSSCLSMKLTIYLHLIPRLRMPGPTHLSPHACICGQNVYFFSVKTGGTYKYQPRQHPFHKQNECLHRTSLHSLQMTLNIKWLRCNI